MRTRNEDVGASDIERLARRPIAVASLLAFACACIAQAAQSTDAPAPSTTSYPAEPVRIIEPFGVGGGPDLLARALAPRLASLWGQAVSVENVTGGGATLGPERVANLPADGHTLLINTNAQAYSAAFANHLRYRPLEDFSPVIPLTRQPYVLVAGKATGVTTIGELVAKGKAAPGGLTFGSTGTGTFTHIGGVAFSQAAGIKAVHVPPLPTDSNADMIANAVAGRFAFAFAPIPLALPHIRDGTLVALGVSTARRSTVLPDVPTISESGVRGFDFPIWYGIWVRAATPASMLAKLERDLNQVLTDPEMLDWISAHGAERFKMSHAEFIVFVRSESERAGRLVGSGVETK
jgi:tripartite-type tricarboxylate transporter receptor subunit TctC